MFSGKKKSIRARAVRVKERVRHRRYFLSDRLIIAQKSIELCVVFFLLSSYFIFTFVLLFVDLTVFIRCRRIKLSFKHYLLLSSFISFHSHRISAVGCGLAGWFMPVYARTTTINDKRHARALRTHKTIIDFIIIT